MYRSRKTQLSYNPEASKKKLRQGNIKCPFCDVKPKEILSKNKSAIVIRNIYGYQYWEHLVVTDHLMIVPIRHVESISKLSKSERSDLMELMSEYESKGYNLYAREKDNVIKSVDHQHTHLIKTKNTRAKFSLYIKHPYLLIRR